MASAVPDTGRMPTHAIGVTHRPLTGVEPTNGTLPCGIDVSVMKRRGPEGAATSPVGLKCPGMKCPCNVGV